MLLAYSLGHIQKFHSLWIIEYGFKGTSAHKGHLVKYNTIEKWPFVTVEENESIIILGEKNGPTPSDPKRT